MKRRTRDWKQAAQAALKGRFAIAIGGMMAVEGIAFLSNMAVSLFFSGTSVLALIIYQAAIFIVSLIMDVLYCGLIYMYLNISRNREYSIKDVFYFFSHQPDRVIAAAFVMTAISTLTSIPYLYMSYTAQPAVTLDEMLRSIEQLTNTMVFSYLLGALLTLPFEMTYYILSDDPEIGGFQALKESFAMMRGKILKFLVLQLSFVPLMLLAMLTLGIGLIWLVPYIIMTNAAFYRDLRGELRFPGDGGDVPAIEERPQEDQDDYNAEA